MSRVDTVRHFQASEQVLEQDAGLTNITEESASGLNIDPLFVALSNEALVLLFERVEVA